MSVSSKPVIIGAAVTPFGQFPDRSVRSLATAAVGDALADAGLRPSDVGMVFFANAAGGVLHGQEMVRGQAALRNTGLAGIPMFNVENACASASSAFALATMAVRSGTVDVALAVGAEKMTHRDRARAGHALSTAADLDENEVDRAFVEQVLLGLEPLPGIDVSTAAGAGGARFMAWYADVTNRYLADSGATVDDLAEVAAKNRSNGARNPNAQFRRPTTAEEVLASRPIAPPIRLLMCSPISDGAAAVVVCSPDFAARLGVAAVRVESVAVASGMGGREDGGLEVIERTARQAYADAGLGPDDIDVVELHDAAATGELMGYEELGLCARGDAAKLVAGRETFLGGRIPVNPSGGLLARGHPIGATGCAQLVEIVDQLRGRAGERQVPGARVGLTQNTGGLLGHDAASSIVTILSRR